MIIPITFQVVFFLGAILLTENVRAKDSLPILRLSLGELIGRPTTISSTTTTTEISTSIATEASSQPVEVITTEPVPPTTIFTYPKNVFCPQERAYKEHCKSAEELVGYKPFPNARPSVQMNAGRAFYKGLGMSNI